MFGDIFLPDKCYHSAADIDFNKLYDDGIRVILSDLDNTLIPHGGSSSDAYSEKIIKSINDAGIVCIIFSNAKKIRTSRFCNQTNLQYITNPRKPSQKGIRDVFNLYPLYSTNNFALIGDQIYTDIVTGKNGGLFTILVDPISSNEPVHIKFKRLLEKPFKNKCRY